MIGLLGRRLAARAAPEPGCTTMIPRADGKMRQASRTRAVAPRGSVSVCGDPMLAQHLHSLVMLQRVAISNGYGWQRFLHPRGPLGIGLLLLGALDARLLANNLPHGISLDARALFLGIRE